MDLLRLLFLIVVVIGFVYLIRGYMRGNIEAFTTQETTLAQTILTFFRSPNNYKGYVDLLIANQNTSPNLAKIETYNDFLAKGNQLTTADILGKI